MGAAEIVACPLLSGSGDRAGPRRQAQSGRGPEAITQTISSADPQAVGQAAGVLARGGVVVLPTDTVYGIAAVLDHADAVKKIFSIKRRPHDKPLAVLVSSLTQARELGRFSPEAETAAAGGWPGALTVVVPAVDPLPQIGGNGSSVGLRVPDDRFVLEVIEECGPLAATSANLSGSPPATSIDQLQDSMSDAVDLYVDGGALESSPSKVVSFLGPQQILRR